jgi:hypothetical protein
MKLPLLRLLAVPLLFVCAQSVCVARNQDGAGQGQQAPPATEPPTGENTQPPEHVVPPKPQFFAGMVTALDGQHIVVSRTLVGKAPETRTFLIQAKTKLSRALHPKQRVTVRYQHLPEGDVALEVQVRQTRSPKAS